MTKNWHLPVFLTLAVTFCCHYAVLAEAPLTTLGSLPEWRKLDQFQSRITRQQFEQNLWVYSPDAAIYRFLDISDTQLKIYSDSEKTILLWELRFALDPALRPLSPYRLKPTHLRTFMGATLEKPLQGLRICLDPGHIGGEWSNVEERYFKIRKDPPIEEATLNIITCQHVERSLIEAGAEVVWTKKDYQPVTDLRPKDLVWEGLQLLFRRNPKAYTSFSKSKLLYELGWNAELAFYRPAEIGARARVVEKLNPDFTICLHYNAAPWRNPKRPRLLKANKLIVFVLGSFMADELKYDDQKFSLINKVLEDSFALEEGLSTSIAESLQTTLELPPENYTSFAAAQRINGNPYVWTRNLLANRLFPSPTIFVESPYMNDASVYARLQAGDYDGERQVQGVMVRSLYRDYAESVSQGIIEFYRNRLTKP